jgi:glucose/arabinose dehydrogenase
MHQLYNRSYKIAIVLSCIFFSCYTAAQPILSFTPRITGLSAPIDFAHPGDGSGRIFIVQKGGAIQVYDSNFNFIKVFTTIAPITTNGERGLLSMAFHPDYEVNRYFFVYYSNSAGNIEIARYRTVDEDSNTVEAGSGQVILSINRNDPTYNNHYGGDLNFGPDGNLYVGVGDGGGGDDPYNNALNPNTLLGKMIRINVDDFETPPYYTIPGDNPYASSADTLKEIWAFGLRNPWRWSFDRLTGDMWLADVGQNAWEELNFIGAGSAGGLNFGWDCFEGNHPSAFPCAVSGTYVPPVFEYANPEDGVSITGGYVYRGSQYPLIYGYYITADFQSQRAWLISPDGAGGFDSSSQSIAPVDAVVAFGESENGELFLVSQSSNSVFQVSSITTVPVTMTSFTGAYRNGRVDLHWEVSTESNVQEYQVEYSTNGTAFSIVGSVAAANASAYAFTHPVTGNHDYYYRLNIVDIDGKHEYSKLVYIKNPSADDSKKIFVVPTVINNRMINVHLDKQYNALQLISLEGKEVWKENITGRSGMIRLQLPVLRQGHYIIRIVSDSGIRTQRIIISN